MLKIVGYPDRYSVAPGEKIAFKISLEEGTHFDARLVRVVHGDCQPGRARASNSAMSKSDADGRHAGKPQRIDAGSYMTVDGFPALAARPFTFFAMIWPTLPKRASQTLLAQWDAKTAQRLSHRDDRWRPARGHLGDGSGKTAELEERQKRCWSGNGMPSPCPSILRPAW